MIAIRKFCMILFILWSIIPYDAAAQTKRVFGKVFNAANEPLPGANVTLKGTTVGTTSDKTGYFSLMVPDNKTVVLVISSVGFAPQEVDVTNNENVTVVLK